MDLIFLNSLSTWSYYFEVRWGKFAMLLTKYFLSGKSRLVVVTSLHFPLPKSLAAVEKGKECDDYY